MRYTLEELSKEVEKANRPFKGVPNIVHGGTSSNRPSDWWRHEDTPESNKEHAKQCFKSLEQKGKLKQPDHTKGDVPIGQNQDWKEFADRV